MAVFQYNNHSIPYQMELAPFAQDLILLQGSRFNQDYWTPVLEDLGEMTPAGGQILTCDWASAPATASDAADFVRLVQTLGLQSVHLVAADDAVEMAQEAQRLQPSLFEKTLFFAGGAPKGEDLKRAVRAFCPV